MEDREEEGERDADGQMSKLPSDVLEKVD